MMQRRRSSHSVWMGDYCIILSEGVVFVINFLLGITQFWEGGGTGAAGIVLKLGVRLEKTVFLQCAGLC